jgi:crossover junction endodeoxyribonuclease RuvC
MRRILGVDPGLRVTGYGAIVGDPPRVLEAGVITPPIGVPLEQRLHALYEQMLEVIAATDPDVMVIEDLWSSNKNPTTAILMGHARGVLYLAAREQGLAVCPLAHSMVKRALTGSGAAGKEQVKRMIMQQLHLTKAPRPDDVSDALALALAHASIEHADLRMASLGIPRARFRRTHRRAGRASLAVAAGRARAQRGVQ